MVVLLASSYRLLYILMILASSIHALTATLILVLSEQESYQGNLPETNHFE